MKKRGKDVSCKRPIQLYALVFDFYLEIKGKKRYNAVKLITPGEAEHTSSSRSCLSNGKCDHLHLPLNAIKQFLISDRCEIVGSKEFLDGPGGGMP